MGQRARWVIAAAASAWLVGCGGGSMGSASHSSASSGPPAAPGAPGSSTAAPAAPLVPTDVLTYKNDLARTGQNLTESMLTPANVNAASFGLQRFLATDGKVDAQPLYVSRWVAAGTAHHALIVATEHDSVYAFDTQSGAVLWQVSLLAAGETPSDDRGCGQVTPEIGVTATPVIDRQAGANGIVFVAAMSKDGAGLYHQRLHALDLAVGAERLGGPIDIAAAYATAGGGTTTFAPGQYEERAALLLANGAIYTTWTSHCDIPPYTGWVIAYAESTLTRQGVFNVAPNSGAGPSIWMSGGGPAADAAGNVYLLTANGAFETTLDAAGFPNRRDFGNSFVKLNANAAAPQVVDYFTVANEIGESADDTDLGSGGIVLLPDETDGAGTVRHLAVGAGKDGNIYVVDRDSMGRFNAGRNAVWQQLTNALPGGIWSTPAYFNGQIYYGDVSGTLKAFSVTAAHLSNAPRSQSATQFAYPGTAPSVSANGGANGIVWAHENASPAVLHAYDAANLASELYNSNQASGNRDHFGSGNKFITPTVADGQVFVGSTSGVAVFGLRQ